MYRASSQAQDPLDHSKVSSEEEEGYSGVVVVMIMGMMKMKMKMNDG